MTAAPLWLIQNVRLADRDGLWQIAIDKGRFGAITPMGEAHDESYEVLNARGGLAIPPFIEPHIHLDTTQTAGEPNWNQSGTLFEGRFSTGGDPLLPQRRGAAGGGPQAGGGRRRGDPAF